MEPLCPKCSQLLPEVKTLKYRFCPHCGAEIAPDPERHPDALLTIPPEPARRQPEQGPENLHLSAETGEKPALAAGFNDQTIAPQPVASRPRPQLKPPDTPPPLSFFRKPAETIKAPSQDSHGQPPAKNRNKIIIVVLISLAVIILILGGLMTF